MSLMSKKQIKIGQIVRPFKILGELKVKCFTDIPQERFKVGSTIKIGRASCRGRV